jgi:prepilin-type N-terminal cleavage/methylation domain-containing protein
MMKQKKIDLGFTLIELAVVLFIIGLLLSSFLAPLAARVEQQERNNTQIQLDEIREILFGHVLQNNYLPCPDCTNNLLGCIGLTANDGIEDTIQAGGVTDELTCATEVGNLPWVTLGVKGTDEWNNVFIYRVDDDFADRDDPADASGTGDSDGTTTQAGCVNITATLGVSYSLCSDGEISVVDAAVAGNPVASFIPAIVISQGKNWTEVASADEAENTDADSVFVDKAYSQTAGAEYDDMLIWISPHVLRTMAVKSGILP